MTLQIPLAPESEAKLRRVPPRSAKTPPRSFMM